MEPFSSFIPDLVKSCRQKNPKTFLEHPSKCLSLRLHLVVLLTIVSNISVFKAQAALCNRFETSFNQNAQRICHFIIFYQEVHNICFSCSQ